MLKEYTLGPVTLAFWHRLDGEIMLFASLGKKSVRLDVPGPHRRQMLWDAVKYNARRFLDPRPCYMEIHSRDCDHFHTYTAHRFPTFYHAMRERERMLWGAEGPISFYELTKAEYKAYESRQWDEAAELAGY